MTQKIEFNRKRYEELDWMPENMHQFDCRRYIKPGDMIRCMHIGREDYPMTVKVTKVYEHFVVTAMPYTGFPHTVNRWDIQAVNGRSIPERSGYFGGLKCLPGKEVTPKRAKILPQATLNY